MPATKVPSMGFARSARVSAGFCAAPRTRKAPSSWRCSWRALTTSRMLVRPRSGEHKDGHGSGFLFNFQKKTAGVKGSPSLLETCFFSGDLSKWRLNPNQTWRLFFWCSFKQTKHGVPSLRKRHTQIIIGSPAVGCLSFLPFPEGPILGT